METLIFIIIILIIPIFMIPKRLTKKEAQEVGYSGAGENCTACGAWNYEEEIDINSGCCYNCNSPFYK